MELPRLQCPRCQYQWIPRDSSPRVCPRCGLRLPTVSPHLRKSDTLPITEIRKQSGSLICPYCGANVPFSITFSSVGREQEIQMVLKEMAANNEEIFTRALAERAKLGLRQAREWLDKLEGTGFLIRRGRTKKGRLYDVRKNE